MPPQPEDQLETMLAAEERAISDDGFSRRVEERLGAGERSLVWRRTAIYGAGLAGLGFAIGGIVEMAPYLPDLSAWLGRVTNAVQLSSVSGAVAGASDPVQMAVAAVLAGFTCLVAAVSLQNR